MRVVITDLDGSLLDADTYSWDAARPAIAQLKKAGIPLILCSSKTRAEIEEWRRELDNTDPFIVENGGALVVPNGYFPFRPWFSKESGACHVVELGARYSELVLALQRTAASTGCVVSGFSQLSAGEIAGKTGLSLKQAQWAKQREYDEAFEVISGDQDALLSAIDAAGYHWTSGGRFFHITGKSDKGLAVMLLLRLYWQIHKTVISIGLGDSLNDAEFLSAVDIPFIVRSAVSRELLERVPNGTITPDYGPKGWNHAILEVLSYAT